MQYRLYVPGDFAAVYAIEEVCFTPFARFSRRYMRQLIGRANTATWVAEEDRGMCGFGVVQWTATASGIVAYIQTLEVIAAMRGKGIGGELLSLLEKSAAEAAAETIWLHVDEANQAAIRVYSAHGYEIEGRELDYYGLGRAGLLYAKPLGA